MTLWMLFSKSGIFIYAKQPISTECKRKRQIIEKFRKREKQKCWWDAGLAVSRDSFSPYNFRCPFASYLFQPFFTDGTRLYFFPPPLKTFFSLYILFLYFCIEIRLAQRLSWQNLWGFSAILSIGCLQTLSSNCRFLLIHIYSLGWNTIQFPTSSLCPAITGCSLPWNPSVKLQVNWIKSLTATLDNYRQCFQHQPTHQRNRSPVTTTPFRCVSICA